jgi:hypothetical protein
MRPAGGRRSRLTLVPRPWATTEERERGGKVFSAVFKDSVGAAAAADVGDGSWSSEEASGSDKRRSWSGPRSSVGSSSDPLRGL